MPIALLEEKALTPFRKINKMAWYPVKSVKGIAGKYLERNLKVLQDFLQSKK